MQDAVDNCISLIEQRFREVACRGCWIDLRHWLQCFAFDAIGEITLSKRFGFLDDGCDPEGLMPTAKSAIIQGALAGVFPELHKPIFKVMKFLGGQDKLKVGQFAQKQVQERMRFTKTDQPPSGEADFLTNLLRLHHDKPEEMSMENVLLTIGGNIGAGSDTTSITLTAIMWHLIQNNHAMDTLRAEIDKKAKSGEISDPISFAQAQKLPYLQAVVKEGLRLHPATGLPLWRVVPQGGAEIAGKYFPEGSTIGINAWVANSNPTIFGENADRFEPERWLSKEADVQRMERNLFTLDGDLQGGAAVGP
ncbi:cytochrome p450 pisatin [Fusarium albosuccineum]|uniref:Cytochrome p450 pisatin n=1 Tax=Fusarium albosuccineum TaxID=1237068 RepID=A0A8H4LF11_9HYPO|nr:cytochrome p450 pisatin [Fusarium albosuccineum]